jgi:5-methylthioadenosine/S-adenosylhomocysteine deaminase
MQEANELSRQRDVGLHIHGLETKTQAVGAQALYNRTLVEHLGDIGLLSPRLTVNHAIWLSRREIELLGEHGCSITHNPLSNMKLGSGVCPVRLLLDAGVNVALGTDGTTTSDTADIVEAIRAASLLHKIGSHKPEEWVSAAEAFRMATLGGARSCLAGDKIGSLEPGKQADIVLLDRDAWGFIPLHDPVRQLAFSVTSEAVTHTIVAGRVLMRERRIETLDEAALEAEIAEAAERFRRDCMPAMRAGSERLAPYVRAIYDRATGQEVPLAHDPHRRPPIGAAGR